MGINQACWFGKGKKRYAKRQYKTYMKAFEALLRIQTIRIANGDTNYEKNIYKCSKCGNYHLTSMELKKKDRIELWQVID